MSMKPTVIAVASSTRHAFSKGLLPAISLLAGLGVAGDAHCGATVRHRSRVAKDPTQPNLRQVHLIHRELLDELALAGYDITPGELGENVTTQGIELLSLPENTLLAIGAEATLRVTGLRNPCVQLERHRPGLMQAVLERASDGRLVRKAGVMAVVVSGGRVRPGDEIRVQLPPRPHRRLEPV